MVLELQRINGTICTDLTGAFPVTSSRGNNLLYIAYSYDANGISLASVEDRRLVGLH